MSSYGEYNAPLTKAVNALAKTDPDAVRFLLHALEAMDDDGFDHEDVLTCLRRGKAYGPEPRDGELRANVVHRGLEIRVSIGGIQQAAADWSRLATCKVVTVMRQT